VQQRVAARMPATEQSALATVAVWSISTVLVVTIATNVAWQRYYVILLPIACLWAGYGLAALARPFARRRPIP
jgi:hypothetical protein